MKKKIVAAVLAGVLALTGIVPFIAETFSVRAEEASVIGEWFGNIWGTPAVMTLDKDGALGEQISIMKEETMMKRKKP